MSKIEDMRRSMTEAGVYSKADIDEICRLESEYEKECSEIALRCGFGSQGYFNYVFKKHTSTTPKKYRDKKRIII